MTAAAPAPADTRDLRFFPVDEAREPQALTRDQVRTYNQEGFVDRVTLFTGDEVARNRASFDHLLAMYLAAGHDSYAVNNCHTSCASIYDLATHPRITAMVADLLGDAFACWSTHFFCKLPHEEKSVTWHQDAPYWPFSPSKTATVWLAIDDVDVGNGAMRVIPGSHRHGALPMRRSRPDEKNVLWWTVDDVERYGRPHPVELRAGQASIHSDMLLHGSPPNPSPRRRCGMTLRYCTLDVRSTEGWNQNSIIIRGTDPSGHWGSVKCRPIGEAPHIGPRTGAN
jgi:hypothetical protein